MADKNDSPKKQTNKAVEKSFQESLSGLGKLRPADSPKGDGPSGEQTGTGDSAPSGDGGDGPAGSADSGD